MKKVLTLFTMFAINVPLLGGETYNKPPTDKRKGTSSLRKLNALKKRQRCDSNHDSHENGVALLKQQYEDLQRQYNATQEFCILLQQENTSLKECYNVSQAQALVFMNMTTLLIHQNILFKAQVQQAREEQSQLKKIICQL